MAGVKGMRQGKVLQSDRHKIRIKASRIVNRLQGHIFGQIKMEPSAVSAALGLLKKQLPDLSNTSHSGDEKNPIKTVTEIRHTIVDPRHSADSDS